MSTYRSHICPVPGYDNIDVVLEPYSYLLQVRGKEVRAKLINAFNVWMKIPDEKLNEIAAIVQMLHTASLLIDDIEDNSTLRRGIPVAHLVYGVQWTINCGNYVYFQAMERCTRLGCEEATHAFLKEMLRLHHGQGFEIFWRDNNICPTEEEYIKMVEDKTGGLFRLAISLMTAFSEDKTDYMRLVTLLGVYFQVRDDYINLCSVDYQAKKSYCEDLTEGKFSFPIIHCIRENPTDHRMLNILKQRTKDVDIKRYAVEYMECTGSFAYTKRRLGEIMLEVRNELAKFPPNPPLEAIVSALETLEDAGLNVPTAPTLRISHDDIRISGSGADE